MDMRKRFHLEQKEYDDRTCIIVVDTVNEVANIPEELVDPPLMIHSGIKSNSILEMGKIGTQVKILHMAGTQK